MLSLVLVLGLAAGASAEPQSESLTLRLWASEPVTQSKHPILLRYRLSTDKSLLIADPTLTRSPTVPPEDWGIMLEVTSPSGRKVRLTGLSQYSALVNPEPEMFQKLNSKNPIEGMIKLDNTAHEMTWWSLYKAGRNSYGPEQMELLNYLFNDQGTYTITAVYNNRVSEVHTFQGDKLVLRKLPVWCGNVRSNTVTIKIK